MGVADPSAPALLTPCTRGLALRLDRPPVRTGHIAALDGLRGWAALWVVLFHLGWETFGVIMPVFRSPLAAAFNGNLAVTVFFVLSGEALSSGYFTGRGLTQVAGLAIKRLPRLSIPVFFATALTYLVARLGLAHDVAPAAAILHRSDWYGRMHPEWMSAAAVIRFAALDVYASGVPRFDRVPFLWTMNTELIGSMLVFVVLLCWSHLRRPEAVVGGLGLLMLMAAMTGDASTFHLGNLADFCFGVVLSHIRHRTDVFAASERPAIRRGAECAILAVLGASALVALKHQDSRFCPVLAPMLVGAISLSPLISNFLSSSGSRWLGRISFPLYLVQYPVMMSLTTGSIAVIAARGVLSPATASLIILASLLACLVTAMLFEPVEILTRRIGQLVGRIVIREPESRIAPV